MKSKLLCIIALLLAIETICFTEIHKQNKATLSTLSAQNAALQQDISKLQATADKQAREIERLTKEIARQPERANRGGERLTSLGTYTVTAYCSCEKCCGEYAKNRPQGKVYGAAGIELQEGVSVAAWLPFGTKLMIDGKVYIVQDRTAQWVKEKYNGRIIDVYFSDHSEALGWGKRKAEVWVLE